ncbi:MAG: outer membrane beta-barrel protein [Candidatus Omnitrophica bacterium]|nr:outer membrane beta-barrel protein [Candidatus Omnitrophota bacterium]
MRNAFQDAQLNYVRDEIASGKRVLRPIFKIKPYFNVGLKYDENIFLTNDNPQTDLIMTIGAGFKFTLGGKFEVDRLEDLRFIPTLQFNLGTQIVDYKKHKELNIKPFMNFDGGFIPDIYLQYNLGKNKNKFNLLYSMHPGFAAISSIKVGGTGQVNYFNDMMEANWEQSFRRFGYHVGLRRTTTSYETAYENSNMEDDMGILTGFFKVTPKTRFFAEINYGITKYTNANSDSNNAKYSKVWVGASGRLVPRVIGEAKIGFVERKYNNGKNDSGLAESFDLTYRKSPKLSFTFRALNEAEEGSYFSEGFANTLNLYLGANYNFNRKFSLALKFMQFEHDKYESGLLSNTYSPSIGFQYLFGGWLSMQFEIAHQERHSNRQDVSYEDNIYNLTATANF